MILGMDPISVHHTVLDTLDVELPAKVVMPCLRLPAFSGISEHGTPCSWAKYFAISPGDL